MQALAEPGMEAAPRLFDHSEGCRAGSQGARCRLSPRGSQPKPNTLQVDRANSHPRLSPSLRRLSRLHWRRAERWPLSIKGVSAAEPGIAEPPWTPSAKTKSERHGRKARRAGVAGVKRIRRPVLAQHDPYSCMPVSIGSEARQWIEPRGLYLLRSECRGTSSVWSGVPPPTERAATACPHQQQPTAGICATSSESRWFSQCCRVVCTQRVQIHA